MELATNRTESFPAPSWNILGEAISLSVEAFQSQLRFLGVDLDAMDIVHDSTSLKEWGTLDGWKFSVHLTAPDHHCLVEGTWYEAFDQPASLSVDIIPSI